MRGPAFDRWWTVPLHNVTPKQKERDVNKNCSKTSWGGRAARNIIRSGLVATVALAASGIASAQDMPQDKKDEFTFSLLPTSTTPDTLPPPQGNSEFLATHGVGTQ